MCWRTHLTITIIHKYISLTQHCNDWLPVRRAYSPIGRTRRMVQEEDGSSILTGEVRHYLYDCLIKNCRSKQLYTTSDSSGETFWTLTGLKSSYFWLGSRQRFATISICFYRSQNCQRCWVRWAVSVNTSVIIPPHQVHSSKINGAVVNLRAKGDKLGVSEASTLNDKGILPLSLEK